MNRSTRLAVIVAAAAAVTAIAWAQKSLKLTINGKAATPDPIAVNGKIYIPLDALKSAGIAAQVGGGKVALTIPHGSAAGGSGQQAAVEGSGSDWLFNGVWRFRVLS